MARCTRFGRIFFAAALLIVSVAALGDTKVTVGVGNMCCDGCKAAAKQALAKLASDVSINGNDVAITLNAGDTNIVPALNALREAGFPPMRIDAGAGPVTLGVAHLCCGTCNANLTKALTDAKIDALDTDSIKIDSGAVTLKAKEGKTLDLATVLQAMEKGGFYANTATLTQAAASNRRSRAQVASRKATR